MSTLILAGDVGGTKANLGFFEVRDKGLQSVREETYPTNSFSDLSEIINQFLKDNKRPVTAACLGVACPLQDGRCEAPNLSWDIDQKDLQAKSKLPRIELINDLVATAYGIPELSPDQLELLTPDVPVVEGNAALLAAGTGLGEAILFWNGQEWIPSPSEGGHTDFSPRDELEIEMLRFFLREFEHVSIERLLSGPGLFRIYRFLRDTGKGEEPGWLGERFQREDPSAVITQLALNKEVPLCELALDRFARLYGAEAGNLALKSLALGGVFLGGGIAPKILPVLRTPAFAQAFRHKGRMADLLSMIRVQVILDPKTALLGAARHALRQLG